MNKHQKRIVEKCGVRFEAQWSDVDNCFVIRATNTPYPVEGHCFQIEELDQTADEMAEEYHDLRDFGN